MFYLIDLFCGMGGVSQGFKQEGFFVFAAVDAWETALLVHEHNHPDCQHVLISLGTAASKRIIKSLLPKLKANDRLHVHASPPCQNLSSVNHRKDVNKGLDMSLWTLQLLMSLAKLDDRITWTIEQVPHTRFIDEVKQMDPSLHVNVVDMCCYGVPQTRKRVIASNVPLVQAMTKSKPPTLGKLLDVPRGTAYISGGSTYSRSMYVEGRGFARLYKYSPDMICTTIMSSRSSFVDKDYHVIRRFSYHDNMALQGFKPAYMDAVPIKMTQRDKLTMTGNCVPVFFSQKMAKALKKLYRQ